MSNTISPLVLRISKIISNFFNPITSLFIYFIYYSSLRYTFQESADIFVPILVLVVLPITIWIYWNVRKGKYSNVDVSDRNQRKGLYFFIEAAIFIYIVYHYFVNNALDFVMFYLLILLVVMQISNYFIKSSMHTAFNVFVSALFFSVNWYVGIIWFGIAIIVGLTRIILKRHTVKEVLSGALIATFISFIYLYSIIQQ